MYQQFLMFSFQSQTFVVFQRIFVVLLVACVACDAEEFVHVQLNFLKNDHQPLTALLHCNLNNKNYSITLITMFFFPQKIRNKKFNIFQENLNNVLPVSHWYIQLWIPGLLCHWCWQYVTRDRLILNDRLSFQFANHVMWQYQSTV